MANTIKLRLLRSYRGYAKGETMDLPSRFADVLIHAGIAERYVKAPTYEAKVVEPEPVAETPRRRPRKQRKPKTYDRRDMQAEE